VSAPEDLADRGAAATRPEIQQQPAAWREVAGIARAESGRVRAFLDPLLAQPGLRVVLTGAGTSAFAGQVLAPFPDGEVNRVVRGVTVHPLPA
jgi:tagatose-6-phosphate ketose/aldose isomerase